MNRSTTRVWWLVGLSPVIFWLTHYVAVLLHEFSHSFMAWILGVKPDPLNIDWGGTGLWNLTLLAHVDENVDYSDLLAAGKYTEVAVIALAGPVIGNLVPYLVTRRVIVARTMAERPVLTFVLFWYLLNGVANLYDYVPTRTFAGDGDVHHFVLGSGISPWVIHFVAGNLVLWAIVDLYRHAQPHSLGVAGFGGVRPARAIVLLLTTCLLFGYFAIPALLESDAVSQFLGRTSMMIIPAVLVVTWRRTVLAPLPEPARSQPLEDSSPSNPAAAPTLR